VSERRVDWPVVVPFIVFTSIWGTTWIVIRDQLGTVPAQWSVAYRFAIAAAAMGLFARARGESLRLDREGLLAAAALGGMPIVLNFNAVYAAEPHVTSGLVATGFALLIVPNSLLAWVFLGQRPTRRFAVCSAFAVLGVALLFVHELREHPARSDSVVLGIGLTLMGLLSASAANVFQARPKVRRFPLLTLLAWAMALGAVADALIAWAFTGPPVVETRPGYWFGVLYLAIFASALAFSLYLPVVRKIGPGRAAYSSVLVPIIAMALSTWLEDYRWSLLPAAGATLVLGGMAGALWRGKVKVAAPDAG
jgi:drug/metabolite transporter (DMT)-like permease